MALNVNRNITDPFYRYKMPKLLAKVEGKGNGIKTVVVNMTEIAKSLERPAMYPTKYFGCELGAQTNFDAKNERYIVNGEHDASRLQDLLDGFIKKFVLCQKCDNPETALTVRRNQINSKCKACGHAFLIDNKHKLSTFIVKNPPKLETDVVGATKVKENGTTKEDHEETNGADKSSDGDDGLEDDDDWADPVDESGALTAGIGKLVIDKDLEKSVGERLDILEKFMLNAKEEKNIGDGKALIDEAERLDVKQKAALLLAVTLLNENVLKEKQLVNFKKAFLRFTLNDKKAQKYLMGGIETLIVNHESELLAKSAHIVKSLYDLDIVDEEVILAWAEKPSSKYVKKNKSKEIIDVCAPVIEWLKEAEEESDEEEEDDDEVAFDNTRPGTNSLSHKARAEAAAAKDITVKTEEGDEIVIDDI